MFQIKKVTLTHRKDLRTILEDFSLVLNDGDRVVMIGEEGNGKSSLMKWIVDPAMVEDYIKEKKPANLTYLPFLPRDEYEKLLSETDVGLVVLSPDFSIPNYPSRILSYMQMAKPILAVTDRVTDIHALVTYEARCGWWCSSDDPVAFIEAVEKICENQEVLGELGANGREYLKHNFNTGRSVDILEKFLEGVENG